MGGSRKFSLGPGMRRRSVLPWRVRWENSEERSGSKEGESGANVSAMVGGVFARAEIEKFGVNWLDKFQRGPGTVRPPPTGTSRAVECMKEELLAQIRQCPTLPSLP